MIEICVFNSLDSALISECPGLTLEVPVLPNYFYSDLQAVFRKVERITISQSTKSQEFRTSFDRFTHDLRLVCEIVNNDNTSKSV